MLQLVEFSAEEEFAKLDRKYAELSDEFKSKMVIEERLLSYQHQLDERARTEIKLEVPETSETNETIPSFTYHNCNLVWILHAYELFWLQCARFKENELARMRMEEREHARKEIDKVRREVGNVTMLNQNRMH